ncbi:SRPBCC family protein [Floricoccus penangensis]|uniref:SRPBCC family protein n=1 Tax=Floricoccus penangensis TaxID=1859475 RepID=UPI00203CC5E1|nr:SRPBCC domain-containing protein [Floricoccus penangensis]URZ88293.1 SRPBCC domain-containing protein [Floricoccus penangensis]
MADVVLDFTIKNSIDKVWEALTDSKILSQWIWDNNFNSEVGEKSEFRAPATDWWDGVVNIETLVAEKPEKLVYIWATMGETTKISWLLSDNGDGTTELHFEQDGFSDETKAREGAIAGATYAWTENIGKLSGLLEG